MLLEGNKKAAEEGDVEALLPHPGGWPLLQDPDDGKYIAMGLFPTPVLMRVQDLSSEELKYGFMHWRVSVPSSVAAHPRILLWIHPVFQEILQSCRAV